MVLSDREIKEYQKRYLMITPFQSSQIKKGVISFGVSSYGYDFRLADEFKIFTNVRNSIVDPKNFDHKAFINFKGKECIIPPNSFALGRSLEYFRIPRDVIGLCIGKSTYARCGIVVNITPLEPEWEGYLTLEISNTTPLPAKVYAGEGIAQIIFICGRKICQVSYADRRGKYQKQRAVTLPKV